MKKFKNFAFYIGLFLAMITFNACQDEFEEINTNADQETITANSATANLVRSASAKDGAIDNVVDNSSCFAIKFPYTVEVNGLEIIVDSFQDLRFLRELVKQYDDDFDDLINIVFPITITYSDFRELTIASLAELRQLASECTNTPDDSRIRCIAFVYPVTLFTFDINDQQTGSLKVESDRQLRRFFSDLDDDTLVGLDFPVTLKKKDGSEITVTTNAELARTIEMAKGLCGDDDDDDYYDDDYYDDDFYDDGDDDCESCSSNQLTESLLACTSWYIDELELNDVDNLEFQYSGYNFSFLENGDVSVVFGDNEVQGTWATSGNGSTLAMVINIPDLPELSTTWRVEEIDLDNGYKEIDLEFGDDNDLDFKSLCGNDPVVCDPANIVDYLQECEWEIYDMNGEFFDDLRLDFSNFNIHVYDDDDDDDENTVLDEGNWELVDNVMIWNDLSATLANYVGEWTIIDCGPEKIKIQRGEEYLYLEKYCD